MMLQSLKLCADQLTGIATATTADVAGAAITTIATAANAQTIEPTTTAADIAAAIAAVGATTATTTSNAGTPVAVALNANGSLQQYLNSSNNNNHLLADGNNLNNIHPLHQYQAKYLTTTAAAAASPTSASKSFHPYLRSPQQQQHHSLSAAASPLMAATSAATSPTTLPPTLFQTLLQNHINSTAAAATTTATAATTSGLLTLSATAATAATVVAPAAVAADVVATAAATSPLNSVINSKTSLADPGCQLALHFQRETMAAFPVSEQSHNLNASANAGDLLGYISPTNANDCMIIANNNNNNNNGSNEAGDDEFSKEEPDADNIKMFVGQVPKSWDEAQLRKLFELYGRVHTLNVLRDKMTSISRGCCFVTYYTRKAALKAQDALHNIKTLEGMHHPIQMKPADSENRNERKLFVGMLNKKYNEADVRQLFAGHGTIEECTVLRDQNGQSKGCAFVTFATKQNAIGAIKTLHQSQTMEGCSAPLVVKFADTQKEKDQKKIQQLQASICGITALTTPATAGIAGTSTNGLSPGSALVAPAGAAAAARSNATMAAALAAVSAPPQQSAANAGVSAAMVPTSMALTVPSQPYQQQTSAYLTADAMGSSAAQLQLFQQLQAFGLHPAQYLQGLNFPPDHSVTAASLSASGGAGNAAGGGLLGAPSISMQNLVTLASLNSHHHPHQHPHHHAHVQAAQQAAQHAAQQAPSQAVCSQQAHHAHLTHLMAVQQSSVSAQPMAAQLTGPTTATLWTDADSLAASPYTQAALNPLANGGYATAPLSAASLQAAAAGVAGKQIEGPDGSNLFIYHLPQEFTDTDLASTFLPFGNVLSAKVFIDKQTNLSKCFGFVSYDNPHSAAAAIQAMHGFQIGTKRLKVQLKRSRDMAKPY